MNRPEPSSIERANTVVRLVVLTAALACASGASAAPWQDLLESKSYQNAKGDSMPYRLLKPETIEPGRRYPLVLFLHGIGERGTNNTWQLRHGVGELTKPQVRRAHPCFIVAPQCPVSDSWVPLASLFLNHAMRDEPTPSLKLAVELTDALTAELPIDPRRVYITGLSMGGFGVWDAISRWPDRFAAAIAICGGGDPAQAAKLRNLPIWAFHGSNDITIPSSRTTSMVEAIRRAGGEPKMTVLPGVGHNCWNSVYGDPDTLDWLFSQRDATKASSLQP